MSAETKEISPAMPLADLLAGSQGRILSKVVEEFRGIGTDTRADLSGQIFVALRGENFDAHRFLKDAIARGAAALLIDQEPPGLPALREKVTVVIVTDTLLALQNLANYWRRKMPARILGLTGSNGKTTTKEFAAQILRTRFRTRFSHGSLNNHWGVPRSLLAIHPSDEVAIIEMGMNHFGELTRLSEIAEPDVVMVTMVGRGHLEGLGSIEGVARAKQEIYDAAKPDAVLCFNLDNPYTLKMFQRFSGRRILTFSSSKAEADVLLRLQAMTETSLLVQGKIAGVEDQAEISVFGQQNLNNLMAAAVLAVAAGMSGQEIWRALPSLHTVWGRNQWVRLPSGAKVLFDGYNANPESMLAALENFRGLKTGGRKFAVLAEMKEMGAHAADVHRLLGEKAAQAGFSAIAFFGPSAAEFKAGLASGGFQKNLFISDTYEQSLASRLLPVLEDKDLVLMKGSRSMKLESVLLDWQPLDFQSDH